MNMERTIIVSSSLLPVEALLDNGPVGLVIVPNRYVGELGKYGARVRRYYSTQDARTAKVPDWLSSHDKFEGRLDKNDLRYLEQRRFKATAMLDRHNWAGHSVGALDRRINVYAEIWSAILWAVGVEALIFHHPPHRSWDFVLMALAEARGVGIAIVTRTSVGSRMVIHPSIETNPKLEWARGADSSGTERWDGPESYYDSVGVQAQKADGLKAARRGLPDIPKYSLSDYFGRLRAPFRRKVEDLPIGVPGQRQTAFGRSLEDVRIYSEIRRYLRRYSRLAEDRIPKRPFIVLALHFQPEATTLPMGGPYLDPLRVGRLLAESLPRGTGLVMKEHHQMFRWRRQWARARDDAFLEGLVDLREKGVHIMAPEVDTSELIEAGLGVATGTGTIGWEALQKGRPVLAFGRPWYSSAPGCHVIEADCEIYPAIGKLMETDAQRLRDDVGLWLSETFKRGSFVGPWDDEATRSEEEREELKEGYSNGIREYFEFVGGSDFLC